MRRVDTESSDDDYGEEFYQPKTRAQKSGKHVPDPNPQKEDVVEEPAPPKKAKNDPPPVVDLIDLGGSSAAPSAPAEQPASQPFQFDFMQSKPAAPAESVDLLGMGTTTAPVAQPQPAPPTANVFDLLSGPTTSAPAPQPPTAMFSGLNLGGAQPAAPQGNSGFSFMTGATQPQSQPASAPVDPFAPAAEPE